MLRLLAAFAVGGLAPAALVAQKTADVVMDSLREVYILSYRDIAMDEMERSGVPASIKLAQALLETRAGTSELAQKANNHFGLKCGKHWSGETYAKNDDEFDANGKPVLSCFRKYSNVVASYADHSAFLLHPEKAQRYGFLFKLDPLDYRGWAEGLQKAGYSPVGHYAERLIFYIERHRLYEYDQWVRSGRLALKRVAIVNGVRMVQAREGETLRRLAQLYQTPVEALVAFNDSLYMEEARLGVGDPVFIEPKPASVGPEAPIVHRAAKDQTLRQIAQLYGVQVQTLRRLNPTLKEAPLAAGTLVSLAPSLADKKPALAIKGAPNRRDTAAALPAAVTVEMLPAQPLLAPTPVVPAPTDRLPSPDPPITINMATGQVERRHTVGPGDTLSSIARRYETSVERLRRLNPGLGNIIRPGQTLRVE